MDYGRKINGWMDKWKKDKMDKKKSMMIEEWKKER